MDDSQMMATWSSPSPDLRSRVPSSTPEKPQSSFGRVVIGSCHVQTAEQRFGPGAKRAINQRERFSMGHQTILGLDPVPTWPGPNADMDRERDDNSLFFQIPSTQAYRNNLTALAQTYDLYFSAYQGCIFVYQPRTGSSCELPSQPDLLIRCEPSREAVIVGGFLDKRNPHTINHIITGVLGTREVIVACFDDGDVVAYDLEPVAHLVSEKVRGVVPPSHRSPPKPFFLKNVGHSAWGLAIHQRCRLIAVSSNRAEVIVFVIPIRTFQPSYNQPSGQGEAHICSHRKHPKLYRIDRVIVRLGARADNIPNICFMDDETGCAEKICAVDVRAALWIADIWKPRQAAVRIPALDHNRVRSDEFFPEMSRGWGVLALPTDNFMTVTTREELVGVAAMKDLEAVSPPSKGSHPILGTGKSMCYVPENPGGHEYDNFMPFPIAAMAELDHSSPEASEVSGDVGDDAGEQADDDDSDEDNVFGGEDEELVIMGFDSDHGDDNDEDVDIDIIDVPISAPEIVNPAVSLQPALPLVSPGLNQLNIFSPSSMNFQNVLFEPDFDLLSGPLLVAQNGMSVVPAAPFYAGIQRISRDLLSSHGTRMDEVLAKRDQDPEGAVKLGRTWSWGSRDKPRTYLPHTDAVVEILNNRTGWMAVLQRYRAPNLNKTVDEDAFKKLGKRYKILRLYEKDIELRSVTTNTTGSNEFGFLCSGVTSMRKIKETRLESHFRAASRLSMVFNIPELRLVVMGSPTGHVVLATMTKLARPQGNDEGMWSHGFRVEWVLPKSCDEEKHRKQLRPLHGIAVGPVNDERFRTRDEFVRRTMPVRYRLMIHYRNHDIFTYEITREEETGKLIIF